MSAEVSDAPAVGVNGSSSLPETDDDFLETQDWLDALEAVVESDGPLRASYLLTQLQMAAQRYGAAGPNAFTTPYVNTIAVSDQPTFPGNREIERRIKSLIRWNAMAMVAKGHTRRPHRHLCLGGHAVRSRLQPHFPGTRRAGWRRPDLLPGPLRSGHLRQSVPRRSASGTSLGQLPPRVSCGRRAVELSAPVADAGLLAVLPRCRWAWGRSSPSIKRDSIATCTIAA